MTCRSDMARIRTIKPEFWQNESLASCTPHARLLAIAILQLADSEGRMRWIPMQVHAHAFPFESDVRIDGLMAELSAIDYAHTYVVDGRTYAYITTFNRHQRLSGKEAEQKSACPEPPTGYDGEATGKQRGKTDRFPGKHLDAQEREREKEKEREVEGKGGAGGIVRAPRFTAPTSDEAHAYADEIGLARTEADRFIDHYTANGWKVGKAPMKDWKAAMRNWKRNTGKFTNGKSKVGERMEITRESIDEHDRAVEQAYAEYDRTFNKGGDSGLSQIGG